MKKIKYITKLNLDRLTDFFHAAGFNVRGGRKRLAQLLGVNRYTLYFWEKGTTRPTDENLRRLVDILNLHLPTPIKTSDIIITDKVVIDTKKKGQTPEDIINKIIN